MEPVHIGVSDPSSKDARGTRIYRTFGVLSLALGVPLLTRAGSALRVLGIQTGAGAVKVTRAVGIRELVAAGGLLAGRRPGWLWARVGGDIVDLGLLTRAMKTRMRSRRRTALAIGAVVGVTAADVAAAGVRSSRKESTAMKLTASTTVGKPTDEVYRFWSDLERLPQFMAHLDEVRVEGKRSHWRAHAPFDQTVEWDAETTEEIPGDVIAWRSLDGADVPNDGRVEFRSAPGHRGTEVHVTLNFDAPAGKLGQAVARYFGEDPRQQLDDDLRRFKQVMETGEVVRSDGAPLGKQSRQEFPQHPARPLSDAEYAELSKEASS